VAYFVRDMIVNSGLLIIGLYQRTLSNQDHAQEWIHSTHVLASRQHRLGGSR